MKKITYKYLNKFNLWMALLHIVQATVMALIAKDFLVPITTNYLTFNPDAQTLEPATQVLFDFPLAVLIILFLLMSGLAHLIVATVYKKGYEKNLKNGINKARWIEYSLSASTMMVAIALLVGIYDISSLLMIFALTAIMNLMGLVMELWNQTTEKTRWLSYYIGAFSGIIPWIVVAIYFAGASSYGAGQIPAFVYWIYVTIFLFFISFAVNMILQYLKVGKWGDYLYGEKVYIILSLTAKTALAWQIFAGTLRP